MSNEGILNLNQAIKGSPAPIGAAASVDGILVATADQARIEIEALGGGRHILITDDSFVNRLLDVAPCNLGGEYLYRDRCQLIGIVGGMREGDVSLSSITSGVIFSDGEKYEF